MLWIRWPGWNWSNWTPCWIHKAVGQGPMFRQSVNDRSQEQLPNC